jgi:phosphoglycolate phosphatase
MVGDRNYDILGAKSNKLKSIGVTYGFGTKQELETAGADYIAEDVEELRKVLLK